MKKNYLRQILYLCILLMLSTSLAACDSSADKNGDSSYKDTGFAMGTVVDQTIYSEDKQVATDIKDLLKTTEEKWISWRVDDSEIASINKNAGKENATPIADDTKEYIQNSIDIATRSRGAFDPTIGKLSRLWGFDDEKNEIPDQNVIDELTQDIGYKNIKLNGSTVSLKKNTSIDLGAMGKGIGCDEIVKYLEGKSTVQGALVNIGGSSIVTYGQKDTMDPWKVAVLNPRDSENYLGAVSLEGTNHISTSGDYERFFEVDNKRYHHILDPSTGFPADSKLMSVTVIGKKGSDCDALSTASFVLGREKSMDLLDEYGAEAIFVDTNKKVYVTDGIKDKFELIAEEYEIEDI